MALWNLFNFARQGNNGNYMNAPYQNNNNYMNNSQRHMPFNQVNNQIPPWQHNQPHHPNHMPPQNRPSQQMQQPLQFQPPIPQGTPPTPSTPQNMGPVSFEPADEETMKEVQRLIKEKMKSEGSTPVEKEVFNPIQPKENIPVQNKSDILGEFIQGEYNAAKFYKQLSKTLKNKQYSGNLEAIADSCNGAKTQLDILFSKKHSSPYAVKEATLVPIDNAKLALYKALEIESRSLRDFINYYDTLNDYHDVKIINSVIFRKICDIRTLDNLVQSL